MSIRYRSLRYRMFRSISNVRHSISGCQGSRCGRLGNALEMLRHTGFGLQGCLLFGTQRGGAIGHPGLGVRRTGPDTDKARHGGRPETAAAFLAPRVFAESAPEASPASSSSLAAPGPLSSMSSSPPAPASPSQPPSPSSMSLSPPSAAARALAAARAPAVKPVTIPRTNPVEDLHTRHVKVHERIVGQIFLLDQGV